MVIIYSTPPRVPVYSGVMRAKVLFVMVEGDNLPSTQNMPENGGRKTPQQNKKKKHHRKKTLKRRKLKNLPNRHNGCDWRTRNQQQKTLKE
jgi:hypothetical protein